MKRYSMVGFLICAALLVLLVPGRAGAQAAPQEMTLNVSEFAITPDTFTATAGQPIHFTVNNTGKFPHSVSFVKDGTFLTVFAAPIAAGKSGVADFTFEEAGMWEMYCPVSNHAERGMTGMVTVLSNGAPGMPTTGQPDTSTMWLAGGLGLLLLAGGLFARRQWAHRSV